MFVAYCVAQVGSLFSADAWNNIGFTAGEVKNPKRDVALSMAFGTILKVEGFAAKSGKEFVNASNITLPDGTKIFVGTEEPGK